MRAANLGEEFDDSIPESVRLTGEEIESMYRLLAIAKYGDRYVIPSGAGSDAHRLDALATGCSLDSDGGPGMTAFDAMADKFHLTDTTVTRQTRGRTCSTGTARAPTGWCRRSEDSDPDGGRPAAPALSDRDRCFSGASRRCCSTTRARRHLAWLIN